jgi:hypothetical protein
MDALLSWFQSGGWPMFVALGWSLFGGVTGLVALGVALFTAHWRAGFGLGAAAVAFACLALATGVVGYQYGMATVHEVLALVEPSQRAVLLAAGQDEAQNNLEMGAIGAALPLLLGLGAMARAAVRGAAGRPPP